VTHGLDPQSRELLEVMRASGLPSIHELSVEQARERMRAAFIRPGSRGPELPDVSDHAVSTPGGERRLRLYRPSAGPLPMALFLHGGGWTVNDLDTHDTLCRQIAHRSGWALAALDYRRAPEHPHPAALEDAEHAYDWLLDNAARLEIERDRCALIGESSGATMAASLALRLRDTGAPIPTLQVLAYPLIDRPGRWPSYERYGSGYTLDREQIDWYFGHVMPDGWGGDVEYLVPRSDRDLAGVAPALVVTAEFDPLRDEGVAYAEQLARCGVVVRHIHAAEQMHGFLLLGGVFPAARRRVEQIADALADHRYASG
jgi:acetyl esterase/lipase